MEAELPARARASRWWSSRATSAFSASASVPPPSAAAACRLMLAHGLTPSRRKNRWWSGLQRTVGQIEGGHHLRGWPRPVPPSRAGGLRQLVDQAAEAGGAIAAPPGRR